MKKREEGFVSRETSEDFGRRDKEKRLGTQEIRRKGLEQKRLGEKAWNRRDKKKMLGTEELRRNGLEQKR